jgi:hypothetical protein
MFSDHANVYLGSFINFGSPSAAPSQVSKSPLDSKKLRALAALKGKSIKKTDPNYVMKRKRSEDDLQAVKVRLKFLCLSNSEISFFHDNLNIEFDSNVSLGFIVT